MRYKNVSVLVISLALFLFVSFWMMSGKSVSFDAEVYNLLHLLPDAIAKPFFVFITNFGNVSVCVVIVVVLTLVLYRTHGKFILVCAIVDLLLNQSIKYIFKRPRPSLETLVKASGYSYPSGHTMIAIMLYGFLLYLCLRYIENKFIKYLLIFIFISLMVFVPISRIYVGVHYPTDIIGGMIVSSCALYFIIQWHKKVME